MKDNHSYVVQYNLASYEWISLKWDVLYITAMTFYTFFKNPWNAGKQCGYFDIKNTPLMSIYTSYYCSTNERKRVRISRDIRTVSYFYCKKPVWWLFVQKKTGFLTRVR